MILALFMCFFISDQNVANFVFSRCLTLFIWYVSIFVLFACVCFYLHECTLIFYTIKIFTKIRVLLKYSVCENLFSLHILFRWLFR